MGIARVNLSNEEYDSNRQYADVHWSSLSKAFEITVERGIVNLAREKDFYRKGFSDNRDICKQIKKARIKPHRIRDGIVKWEFDGFYEDFEELKADLARRAKGKGNIETSFSIREETIQYIKTLAPIHGLTNNMFALWLFQMGLVVRQRVTPSKEMAGHESAIYNLIADTVITFEKEGMNLLYINPNFQRGPKIPVNLDDVLPETAKSTGQTKSTYEERFT